jgi:hypothetical protein
VKNRTGPQERKPSCRLPGCFGVRDRRPYLAGVEDRAGVRLPDGRVGVAQVEVADVLRTATGILPRLPNRLGPRVPGTRRPLAPATPGDVAGALLLHPEAMSTSAVGSRLHVGLGGCAKKPRLICRADEPLAAEEIARAARRLANTRSWVTLSTPPCSWAGCPRGWSTRGPPLVAVGPIRRPQ